MFGLSSRGTLCLLAVSVFCAVKVAEGIELSHLKGDSVSVLGRDADEVSLRLPNDTIPIHYDLSLTTRIHSKELTYNGQVDIQIKCVVSTSTIVLHSRVAQITKVSLKSGASETELKNFSLDDDTEFLTILLDTPLVANQEYTLTMVFTGEHSTNNQGWFQASYTNDNGEEVFFAPSDFETYHARKVFPCYDEPDKKATFKLSITHHQSYHAISNMPSIEYIVLADGLATTHFNTTPLMSTYVLAFMVSDFESTCNQDSKGREECVYTRPNAILGTKWALDTAMMGLEELEAMLNIEFPLSKMDQVAIPDAYLIPDAMENWGMVTYQESGLLVADTSYYQKEKYTAAGLVMHEMSLQWFGDLVTPKWWTYLWMNEGMATLFEYYATDKVYPNQRIPDLMVLECMHKILINDAGRSPTPVTHYVETQAGIDSRFTYVSFHKAGILMRMMMLALGEETFYTGLKYYLEKMSYKNAVAEDLFAALQKAADESKALPEGVTVKTILDSWTLDGGYPLITAARDTQTKVSLSQSYSQLNNPISSMSRFYIPITYTESRSPDFESAATLDWFRGDADEHELTVNAESSWYILNKQQSSYYRVNYDENNWRQLAAALRKDDNFDGIHVLNRAQLLDDSFDMSLWYGLNVTIPFDLFKHLANETDYIPWAAVEDGLLRYYQKLKLSDSAPVFAEFLRNSTAKMYEKYGSLAGPEDSYFDNLARNFAIRWACRVGNENCLSDTSEVMAVHYETGKEIDPNIGDILSCAGARAMNATHFNLVFGSLIIPVGVASRDLVMDTLSCTYNPEFIYTILNRTLEEDSWFRGAEERLYVIQKLATRDYQSMEITLDFLRDNIDELKAVQVPEFDLRATFYQMASSSYSKKLSESIKNYALECDIAIDTAIMDTFQTKNLAWMAETGDMIMNFLAQSDEEPKDGGASSVVVSGVLVAVALVMSFFRM